MFYKIVLLLTMLLFTNVVMAEDTTPTYVVLAQQCIGEIGFTGRDEECIHMWAVLDEKASNEVELVAVVKKYNSVFKVKSRRSKWVLGLNYLAGKPKYWPSNISWERHRNIWIRKMKLANSWLQNRVHPCPEANHYGGRCDDKSNTCDPPPPCWKRIWCGHEKEFFAQAYYHRPAGGCYKATVRAYDVKKSYATNRE